MNAAARSEVNIMKNNTQETRIALLEQSVGYIHESLNRIEHTLNTRFDDVDKKFESTNRKIEELDKKFDLKHESLNSKIDANNKWLIGLAISVFFSAATLGFGIYSFIHKLS